MLFRDRNSNEERNLLNRCQLDRGRVAFPDPRRSRLDPQGLEFGRWYCFCMLDPLATLGRQLHVHVLQSIYIYGLHICIYICDYVCVICYFKYDI
jgi:hypothetical protein